MGFFLRDIFLYALTLRLKPYGNCEAYEERRGDGFSIPTFVTILLSLWKRRDEMSSMTHQQNGTKKKRKEKETETKFPAAPVNHFLKLFEVFFGKPRRFP